MFDREAMETLPFSGGMPDKVIRRLELQEMGHMVFLLALIDDRIVGNMLVKWNCPEDPFLKQRLPQCAEIEDFAVAGELQGRGIGSHLLAYAEQQTTGHDETRLGLAVGHENVRAKNLYLRRGFKIVPDSGHRVSWFAPNPDGTSRVDSEECVYMMKVLL